MLVHRRLLHREHQQSPFPQLPCWGMLMLLGFSAQQPTLPPTERQFGPHAEQSYAPLLPHVPQDHRPSPSHSRTCCPTSLPISESNVAQPVTSRLSTDRSAVVSIALSRSSTSSSLAAAQTARMNRSIAGRSHLSVSNPPADWPRRQDHQGDSGSDRSQNRHRRRWHRLHLAFRRRRGRGRQGPRRSPDRRGQGRQNLRRQSQLDH
jgi:hypothetical protein